MKSNIASARQEAARLDATDPLAPFRQRFVPLADDVIAYLDGNSLGRPLRTAVEDLGSFVSEAWGNRLIRGWSDEWLDWPTDLGDKLGGAVLGAGPGQVIVADSTSVLLYKLARAALNRRGERDEILVDTDNFPTDRYVLEGIATELKMRVRWIRTSADGGVEPQDVAAAVGPETALAVFSHVAYRSGHLADAEAITQIVHEAGGMILWDVSHSVGSVPVELDEWKVDLAVGCTYKYLNGGPGSPAFAYMRSELQDVLQQPIWGWMGRERLFEMEAGYQPATGIRRLLSGTPPILGMVPLRESVDLIAEAGIDAIRAKSVLLTEYALDHIRSWPDSFGVEIASPQDSVNRGGHVTIRRSDFCVINDELWRAGVLPDFRAPDGIRIGLAPLSTSFAEVCRAMEAIGSAVTRQDAP